MSPWSLKRSQVTKYWKCVRGITKWWLLESLMNHEQDRCDHKWHPGCVFFVFWMAFFVWKTVVLWLAHYAYLPFPTWVCWCKLVALNTLQVLPGDPFGCFKRPVQGLSDLHLGYQKVTWKKLAIDVYSLPFLTFWSPKNRSYSLDSLLAFGIQKSSCNIPFKKKTKSMDTTKKYGCLEVSEIKSFHNTVDGRNPAPVIGSLHHVTVFSTSQMVQEFLPSTFGLWIWPLTKRRMAGWSYGPREGWCMGWVMIFRCPTTPPPRQNRGWYKKRLALAIESVILRKKNRKRGIDHLEIQMYPDTLDYLAGANCDK